MEEAIFDNLVPFEHAIADYRRWKQFEPRAGDVFVCTPGKCGTTWMQTICCNLVRPDGDFEAPVAEISPWIEATFQPEDEMHAAINRMAKRRVLKSHAPATSVPWFDHSKYIFVGRDGRDAFMSWLNHNERMKVIDDMNRQAQERNLPPMPKYNGDPHAFFEAWLQPKHAYFGMIATYWEQRHRDNLLLVHYADLKSDLEGEIRRIAEFLDITLADAQLKQVVERCTFEYMREHPEMVGEFEGFEGGLKGFIFKGTNGRWKDVLTEGELAAYEARLSELVPPGAAAWSKQGQKALI
jgi:aryl sulfotransferase